MKSGFVISVFASLVLLISCGGSKEKAAESSELLKTVPSDAIALVSLDRCEKGLASVLDSSDVLRRVDYGHLSGADAILSTGYIGTVEKLLSIDAGRVSEDTSATVRKILDQVGELNVSAAFVNGPLKRSVLLLSSSETMVKVALRHIDAGTSILDAPDFDLALQGGLDDMAVVRNIGARRILKLEALSDFIQPRRALDFIQGLSEWVVMPAAGQSRMLRCVRTANPRFFLNFATSVTAGKSMLGEALPEGTRFVVSASMDDCSLWRSGYEKWLDANARLERYKKNLSHFKSASGKDPLKWEKEQDVKEVAKVVFEGGEVLLVRPGRRHRKAELSEFSYAGFIPSLYGDIFSTADQSCVASTRHWDIIGSQDAVEAYLDLLSDERCEWPKKAAFVIKSADSFMLTVENENIVLKTNN